MAMMTQPGGHMSREAPAYRSHGRTQRTMRRPNVARAITGACVAREVVIVVLAYFAYFLVRGLTEGERSAAVSHARTIVSIEKAGGFFWEPAIQAQIVHHHAIVTAANWVYIYGHWPLIACVAAWLLMRRTAAYALFRNAFLISGTIGIVAFVLFPVAPPRLADVGVVDTVTMYSNSYRVVQPPAFVNQYAAVPSLHFGWDLLIGIALITQSRWLAVRILGAVVPMLMLAAIVLTANHYIFDAMTGAAVALTGLGLASALRVRSDAQSAAHAPGRLRWAA